MDKVNIFWFRRDLRWTDNVGLAACLQADLPTLPVFIFDTEILSKLEHKDDARITFIHDLVTNLSDKAAEAGGRFIVKHGKPQDVFIELAEEYEISGIFTNRDYEPYARERDEDIAAWCKSNDIGFNTFKDHVIFEKSEVVKDDGDPYSVFTPYSRKWKEKLSESDYQEVKIPSLKDSLLKGSDRSIPSLKDLGFKRSDIKVPEPQLEKELLTSYEEERDYPAQNGTARVSPHLRFGSLSIRSLVRRGLEHSDKWLTELIWRDFYQMILWHHPHTADKAFKPKYDRIPWSKNEDHFDAWCEGKTGYPLVDAGMRQLNQTGFMHNRVRMVVASFLTKHLLLDWRWGERYFAEKLLDYELASNVGGWQWAAGSGCDAAPYFRIFNPHSQLDKYDPKKTYVKEWVEEFGTDDYPEPIVVHKEARQKALDTYKEALD